MGVAVWLMARLCRVGIRAPGVLVYGGLIWNIGVAAGILSILLGEGRGLEGARDAALRPRPHVHRLRADRPLGRGSVPLPPAEVAFISVWYLLGALFWFPWIFATANVLLSRHDVSRRRCRRSSPPGTPRICMGWWFTSVGLAAAYFFIPKVMNRPVHSYNLASLGFWTFAIFSGLTGMVRLSGGPIPAWMVTVSISASIMMLVPVSTVSVNLLMTMRGRFDMVFHSPTIRFTVFGVDRLHGRQPPRHLSPHRARWIASSTSPRSRRGSSACCSTPSSAW